MGSSASISGDISPGNVIRLTGRQEQLRDQLLRLFLAEGFVDFTLDDLAGKLGCSKRTLYALADSKEQLATSVTRLFFRRATDQVEAAIARLRSPERRVTGYLEAVAEALRPASRQFLNDLSRLTPTREIYVENTTAAAARLRSLVDEGTAAGAFREVQADFLVEVVTATMQRIGSGRVQSNTGLDDAEAYAQLAQLVLAAVRA
ncbi:TetR family transcriptional regulator [Enemella evansiae]|uniref:TetR family transcriptional regulator n=1 Tax=Enemella evansiae TaxID=2016499 RepID=A0A255G8F5_9ACTN|nr:TetR family transcriptional regulator [Enemella evansiae]OYO09064.1 TetR family transcriptional regulator [Enemella evansiae]OYO11732.1 TetR family transcriptional regulator [Enemella evansiae]TDO85945.1 TetR family transcriptional regulator [Enemella evansiae]